MYAEKQYLIDLLRRSGLKARIHESMKSLSASGEIQTGGVIRYGDDLERSGSKRIFEDQDGARHKRFKVWNRKTKLKVIIGDASEEKCEAIFQEFLKNLDSGIWINGNWTAITVESVDWVDEKDSILKSRMAVEFLVIFDGGIYRDSDFAVADKVSLDVGGGHEKSGIG